MGRPVLADGRRADRGEENELYKQAGVVPGDVWRDVVVTGRQYQSPTPSP